MTTHEGDGANANPDGLSTIRTLAEQSQSGIIFSRATLDSDNPRVQKLFPLLPLEMQAEIREGAKTVIVGYRGNLTVDRHTSG